MHHDACCLLLLSRFWMTGLDLENCLETKAAGSYAKTEAVIARPNCQGLGLDHTIFVRSWWQDCLSLLSFHSDPEIKCDSQSVFLRQLITWSLNTAFRLTFQSYQKRYTLFKLPVVIIWDTVNLVSYSLYLLMVSEPLGTIILAICCFFASQLTLTSLPSLPI